MAGLTATTIVGIGGLVIGLIIGAVSQRTNFCTMGGISDLVLMGEGRRIRAWVLAIAVAIIGTHALHFAGAIDVNKSVYLTTNLGWLGAIVGGLMFGFGMTQTSGCASRTLVRVGGGNLKALVVALVIGTVGYMTMRGLIAPARMRIEGASNIDLKGHGLSSQNVGEMAGAVLGLDGSTARAIAAVVVAAAMLLFCFRNKDFRRSLTDIVGGVIIGLAVVGGWAVTGVFAADEFEPVQLSSITLVAPTGDSLQYLMTYTGATINFGIAVVGGIVAGSFAMAIATGRFRVEGFADRNDLARNLSGAALMGIGGVLAMGCTFGQGVTGMSTLALASVLAWGSIVIGGYFGVKYLEEGGFAGAFRAMLTRS
jgi:uncharacterized membrane protein YedE/YeeE